MFARTGRLGRADRLLDPRDFQRVARDGRRTACQHFVVLVARSGGRGSREARRLGITVSRRVGNAVVRNRIKRGVREWFRRSRCGLPAGTDVVVIARRQAAELSAGEVGSVLDEMLFRSLGSRS